MVLKVIYITFRQNRSYDIEIKDAITNIVLKKGYTEWVIKVIEWEKAKNVKR